ncbi:predicted protein [Botrytis cinerea T4]|uniref:Uncharacterized protein n=1 Tax=Botryotinia fuckeliana (strain T4) TaxID=999810 RepID=G2XTS9_BOTF4|nr:predicted protein [Botrytis cinerea T4]
MGGQNIEFLSLDEDFELTWKHIMSLARGKSREQPPDYQPMRSKFFDRISGWSKEPKRVQITDSGQRRVKETITTVLKAVVLGDESIVGAATTDDDLKELGAVAGAVIHAIKKAEVPADWGWEGRYYEIVKIYDENWEDLLRLLCEFTPDIDVQAVANITDVDNSDVWGMPHNFSHRP